MHTTSPLPSCSAQYRLFVHTEHAAPIEIRPALHIPEQSLAQGIWLSGKIPAPALCSGLGRCGACKVQFISPPPAALPLELSILGEDGVAQGWRLSCRHRLDALFAQEGTIHLKVPESCASQKALPLQNHTKNLGEDATKEQIKECRLAIDLGTTSLCWQAVSPKGEILSKGSQLNPQMGAGADIISRLALAMHKDGKAQLSTLVRNTVQTIIADISAQTPVTQLCLAANTAMTAIFLEKDVQSLAHAPYALPLQGHETVHIQDWPPLYIPPQLAPFVGGDISAGYAALLQKKDLAYPFVLADLGTNGEFILALSPEKALLASVPMGPSLEGIGLRFGHMAHGSPGIVHNVRLSPTGLTPQTLQGDAPQKICGTGYLSLIHILLTLGCITHQGLFAQTTETKISPLFKKIMAHLALHHGEKVLFLWPTLSAVPMYLSGSDVEEIVKVKAAFSFALSQLLAHAHLTAPELQKMYIAGAMGLHVDSGDLEGLGFLPQGMGARTEIVGNSALDGAKHLVLDSQLRTHLAQWSRNCVPLSLTEDQHFTEKFLQHMNFSYTG